MVGVRALWSSIATAQRLSSRTTGEVPPQLRSVAQEHREPDALLRSPPDITNVTGQLLLLRAQPPPQVHEAEPRTLLPPFTETRISDVSERSETERARRLVRCGLAACVPHGPAES